MSEYVNVPTSLWGIQGDIADATMQLLVKQGKLPGDFEFRALAIEDDEADTRGSVALQDILAAMGRGEPTHHPYLTQELPDCVQIYAGGTKSVRKILSEIDTEYHQLGTLLNIASDSEIQRHHAYQAWFQYIKFLDPKRYDRYKAILEPGPMRGSLSKQWNLRHALGTTIIRDSALMPIYENPKLVPGHGPIKQGLLRILLQDNHPEIEQPPED